MTGHGLLALAIAALSCPAHACPDPGGLLLFHSCWGRAGVELITLPEEEAQLSLLDGAAEALLVTGGYTGKDTRDEGLPNPVGLFIDDAKVINPNLARMDGVLVIDPGRRKPRNPSPRGRTR